MIFGSNVFACDLNSYIGPTRCLTHSFIEFLGGGLIQPPRYHPQNLDPLTGKVRVISIFEMVFLLKVVFIFEVVFIF